MHSREYFEECFLYKKETGEIFWKERPVNHFKSERYQDIWNARHAGSEFGRVHTDRKGRSYRRGMAGYKFYQAHRIIWVLENGDIPPGIQVDHINHNGLDNRIENLRLVTNKVNSKNRKMSKANKSGRTGVYWYKPYNKWLANIKIDGGTMHLGYFTDKNEAIRIRDEAEIFYGYHENHGKL